MKKQDFKNFVELQLEKIKLLKSNDRDFLIEILEDVKIQLKDFQPDHFNNEFQKKIFNSGKKSSLELIDYDIKSIKEENTNLPDPNYFQPKLTLISILPYLT